MNGNAFPFAGPYPWDAGSLRITVPYYKVPTLIESADLLPDVFSCGGEQLCVSERCREALSNLTIDPRVPVIPATIFNRVGREIATYYYMYSLSTWDVIDYARAEVTYVPGTTVAFDVQKWVLRHESIPKLDLFLCETFKWIATENVKECFDRLKISGCQFVPIAG